MSVSGCLSKALADLSRLQPNERDAYIARLPDACPRPTCTTGIGCRAYVASRAGSEVEHHRRACEARHHLRCGATTPSKVQTLLDTITKLRGPAAAHQLRDEMRVQWANRAAWLRGGRP